MDAYRASIKQSILSKEQSNFQEYTYDMARPSHNNTQALLEEAFPQEINDEDE